MLIHYKQLEGGSLTGTAFLYYHYCIHVKEIFRIRSLYGERASGVYMKIVKVVAAVIHDKDKIFATARGYGEF